MTAAATLSCRRRWGQPAPLHEERKMKRYSILARHEGRDREVEICQCDSNPEAIAEAARMKTVKKDLGLGKRPISIPMYEHVRIKCNEQSPRAAASAQQEE
jgi:hypothetical protein